MRQRSPGSLTAAWFNIVVCGAIIAGAVVMGATSDPGAYFIAVVGVTMEFFFVRVLVEIHKERRNS